MNVLRRQSRRLTLAAVSNLFCDSHIFNLFAIATYHTTPAICLGGLLLCTCVDYMLISMVKVSLIL